MPHPTQGRRAPAVGLERLAALELPAAPSAAVRDGPALLRSRRKGSPVPRRRPLIPQVMSPKTLLRFLLALAAWGGGGRLVAAGNPGAGLRVTDLRCEFAQDPLGVDVTQPRLFWRVASDERSQRQTAWQALVASSAAALAADRGDLWDSGRVSSDETTFVRYAGAVLASSQQVFWKVRAWDRDGRLSAWSAPASWTMGLLAPADWKGVWIAAPGDTESLLLRHEFSVRPGLRRAVAHVCGLGQYEMFLNGTKAGVDLLSPGWTNYDVTALYDTRDVTLLLREGRNVAGLLLGNGFYHVALRDRFTKLTTAYGPLRAILHLRLEYADGTVEFVGTDPSWRTLAGPITTGNIYAGEDYDARRAPAGWTSPGFDDRAWARAVALLRPPGTLRGHSAAAEPLREIETHRPVTVRTFPDGTAVYDLGQNASHMPRLRVSGPTGSIVRITPAEIVNDDGTINRNTMDGKNRGNAWWQYTKATDSEETWFPHFYYVGCRYLKVECFRSEEELPLRVPAEDSIERSSPSSEPRPGDPARLPHIESLEGVVVHSSAAPLGHFVTSNPLFNRIRDLVRWAQRSNMVSVLTDCPHREKLGWLEAYHLNGPAIRYEFDVARIFAKDMRDMADEQTDDGLVPNIAPEYTKFQGTFRAAAEWGAAFILVPWQQYQFTGDLDLVRTHFDAMKRYFAYLETRATDNLLSEGLGDWYDLGPEKLGPAQLTPPPVTATAFYYYDASILAQAAALLGRADEAKDYAARAARIQASYNRHFFHSDTGSYATGSQCANALPLVLDLVEPADRARVLTALVRDVEQHGCAMTTGDVGFRFLLQALARGGRSDVIYRMINQTEKPGYGYQLKSGATSLTESWDANLASSHNHFMLGQVTEWFYKDLAGIDVDPAGPGFKKILLHPSPIGNLASVEASYDSIHGPISLRWERVGDRFTLKAEIPANTTATVFLPAREGAAVLEDGAAAERSAGVTCLRREGDRAVFFIESGRYTFETQWAGPEVPAR